MGKADGFLTIARENPSRRPVPVRLRDWREVYEPQSDEAVQNQAARCMDCGIPFCHQGCPLGNLIPEWNDLAYKGKFAVALDRLHQTNNFPEFTGRLCPAPCESACVVSINTVFERQEAIGGLLRYGIPEFKMEKAVLDRRLAQLEAEGVRFVTGVTISDDGANSLATLRNDYDAVIFAIGSTTPRDIPVPGRSLEGIYPAMTYLKPANVEALGGASSPLRASGKHVVILGGGDTGADCLGTAHRQGAASVVQIELLPQPTPTRPANQPWPTMPAVYKVTSAHEEGGERQYAMRTKAFHSNDGARVTSLTVEHLRYHPDGSTEVTGEDTLDADLVLLAAGFVGPEIDQLATLPRDGRQHIRVNEVWLSLEGDGSDAPVFAAGDAVRGQSLIVWAIAEGRSVAAAVHAYLAPDAPALPAPLAPYEKSWESGF